jgi:two-component system capsular synthesis response regulator RcsB
MFERVLVAEDQEMMNLSLRRTLEDLQLPWPDYAFYCDLAFSKIKKALTEGAPYELLVTDLYFEVDGSAEQKLDGTELIKNAKTLQPQLKVLVFSAEGRPRIIRSLFDDLGIDGYVRKSRGDAQNLQTALNQLKTGRKYFPRELRSLSGQDNLHTFTDYDKTVIRLLSEGYAQKDIPDYLQHHDIRPSGLSSVEKRLNTIKMAMGFAKNEQLVAFCKEMSLI